MKLIIIFFLSIFLCDTRKEEKAISAPPQHLILDGYGLTSENHASKSIAAKNNTPFPLLPPSVAFPLNYFHYKNNAELEKDLKDCSPATIKLWKDFEASGKPAEDFNEHWKNKDPFCWKTAEKLSPKMFFSFRGEENKEYYLDSLNVDVVNFTYNMDPKKGEFVEGLVRKDILLSMTKGITRMPMSNPKLHFKGRGKVEYTFWSDHKSRISADAAPGKAIYLIGLQFRFSDDTQHKYTVPESGFLYFMIDL